jgi:hypothetical protein
VAVLTANKYCKKFQRRDNDYKLYGVSLQNLENIALFASLIAS